MKITKMILSLIVAIFLAVPAWANGIPEFDAVGIDAANIYANDLIYRQIILNGQSNQSYNLPGESFTTNAGESDDISPCTGALTAMAPPYASKIYTWEIMLQARPDSDINIKIMDCIECASCGVSSFWGNAAEQTGRATFDFVGRVWVPGANPNITVTANPGPNADLGFTVPYIMSARRIPLAFPVPLWGALYTSKGNFAENLMAVLPVGGPAPGGWWQFPLSEGDTITVQVVIPSINNQRIYYGSNECILEYVGVAGTAIGQK